MVRMTSGAQDWAYVYTAGDERLWSYDLAKQEASRWALRDLSGQVLREYLNDNGTWTVGTDYIHRDGQLLAAETRLGRRHFHLDHLGTPRLITSSVGYKKAYHVYYPFGEEATPFNQDGERMKFTGYERDLANPAGAGDDLDYMRARHYSPVTGRFLGTDRAKGKAKQPRGWNRYSYGLGNPIRKVDPDGKTAIESSLLLIAAVAVMSRVAAVHAEKMRSDSQYRQRVVDGATRTGEATVATISSVLSKRTDDGSDAKGEATRGRRGRFKNFEDGLEQLGSIEHAQDRLRQGKAGEIIIDSIEKSKKEGQKLTQRHCYACRRFGR